VHALLEQVNNARYRIGTFSTPSLKELRARANELGALSKGAPTKLLHVATTDVFEMHSQPEYNSATFMAASQFNCLEFPSPYVTPENGVTGYQHDPTQGPACALAAGPATVYRNYFVDMGTQVGQSADLQINNLQEMLDGIGGSKPDQPLVDVENGYTSSSDSRLVQLNKRMASLHEEEILGLLRVGLHAQVEVPWARRWELLPEERRPLVTQVYCSALSCGYSDGSLTNWMPLARKVLDASYEATLLAAAIEKAEGTGSGKVVLTLLGGGVFGNADDWIEAAIARAVALLPDTGLDVVLAHFRFVDDARIERIERGIAQRSGANAA